MNHDIISLEEITQFHSPTEEFNPYDWYKHKLQHEPIVYNQATHTWNVFRYNDVKRVLKDHEYFSSARTRTTISVGADNAEGQKMSKINLQSDPPEHQKSRALISAAFTPRSLKLWEPRIQEIADQLLNELGDADVIDIVQNYASALPTIVIADLLGVPSEDRLLFKEWVNHLFLPLPKDHSEDIQELKRHAAKEYYNYLYPHIVQKEQIYLTISSPTSFKPRWMEIDYRMTRLSERRCSSSVRVLKRRRIC